MGYCIKKLPKKKSYPKWKVQFVSRKREDAKNKIIKYPSRAWDIPKRRWSELGISEEMDFEEARLRCSQLNRSTRHKRSERKRIKLDEAQEFNKSLKSTFLPSFYKKQFEQRYFYGRDQGRVIRNKSMIHWKRAQELILELKVEPKDWDEKNYFIYDWFFERAYSFSYIKKILGVLNLWGAFLSKRRGTPFVPVAIPRGREKSRLIERFYQLQDRSKVSEPITPRKLEVAKSNLIPSQYNWLYISIWLGLRPKEIDNLRENSKIMQDENGELILWVYQSKIVTVAPVYRWKPIPLIFPEQKKVVEILRSGDYSRPLAKTVRKYIGENHSLYGGRKGFVDLMISLGQRLENICQWMGHSTIDRTWKHYKNKQAIHYNKTG